VLIQLLTAKINQYRSIQGDEISNIDSTYEGNHGPVPRGSDSGLERARVLGTDERQCTVEIVFGHAPYGLSRVSLAVRKEVVHVVPGGIQSTVHVLSPTPEIKQ